jgi:metal-responsive CopG/Arc/MetJ family transcriptional regulator
MSGKGRLGPSRQLHVKVPAKLYDKLWEFVKSTSEGSVQGVYSKVIREAIKEYLERRGVKVDE